MDGERALIVTRGVILVVTASFVLIMLLFSNEATFTVSARTETLTLTLKPGDRYPSWGKPSGIAFDDFDQGSKELPCSKLTVSLDEQRKSPLAINFTLGGGTGPAEIAGRPARSSPALSADFNSGPTLGKVDCDGKITELQPPFHLIFRPSAEGIPLTVPFLAPMQLGGDVKFGTVDGPAQPNLLIDGSLIIEASSWPSHTGQVRSEASLNTGDVLTFDNGELQTPLSAGIIRTVTPALDDPYLLVVARSTAKQAKVISPYGLYTAAYAPSSWERLQAMGQWAGIIALATLIIGLLDLARDFVVIGKANNER